MVRIGNFVYFFSLISGLPLANFGYCTHSPPSYGHKDLARPLRVPKLRKMFRRKLLRWKVPFCLLNFKILTSWKIYKATTFWLREGKVPSTISALKNNWFYSWFFWNLIFCALGNVLRARTQIHSEGAYSSKKIELSNVAIQPSSHPISFNMYNPKN